MTVIQHTDRICPFLDLEVSKSFQRILTKQGIKFKCNTGLKSGVNNKEKGVDIVLEGKKGEEKMTADVVLLSIGRRPYTGGLGLDKAGLDLTDRGQVPINKQW